MSTDTALPESITIYEVEHPHLDDLDFDYIDKLGSDLAGLLQCDVAECCYQPGDGTRYPLVIMPLFMLRHGSPRVVDGIAWERHAISGLANPTRSNDDVQGAEFYQPNSYLVVWVEHAAYPIRLGGGRRGTLAAGYVAEKMKTSETSGVSIAVLLRAVGYHLDQWAK